MLRIFRREDEGLRLDDTRLKASSRADATRRLTYLFVYANETEGRKRVSRNELNEALRDVGLYDTNSRKALKDSDFVLSGDEIGLRTGRETACVYMNQMFDPEVIDAWPISSPSRSRGAKSSGAIESGAENNIKAQRHRGRALSQIVDKWVTAWRDLDLGVDSHRIVQQASNTDRGIFGLWAIRRAVDKEGRYVTRNQLARFLYEAFVVKVDDSTLGRALSSDAAKEKVLRVKGTTFEITPTGITYAEQMAGISS